LVREGEAGKYRLLQPVEMTGFDSAEESDILKAKNPLVDFPDSW